MSKSEMKKNRFADGVLTLALCVGVVLWMTGCVTAPEADLIRARMAQKTHDMLETAATEVETLGDKQVRKDVTRTASAIDDAYKGDMAEAVQDGSTEGALKVVDLRDEKLSQMKALAASKRGKYGQVADKLRIGARAALAVDEIAQHQSEATAKAWKGFLTEDLPAAAGELASSYASAKAAAEAASTKPTTDPTAPAEPDTTDLIDGGK